MEPDFWHARWREGQIGFHRAAVEPALAAHWTTLIGPADGRRVLVPLCGKSHDLRWLLEAGHRVVGVELSAVACRDFFVEQGWQAAVEEGQGRDPRTGRAVTWRRHRGLGPADGLELVEADILALPDDVLGSVELLYDRASLIALPAGGPQRLRERLVERLAGWLPTGARGLLVTMDYPQEQRRGPPFAIGPASAEALLGAAFEVEMVAERDLLAEEGGSRWPVDRLSEHTLALRRR